MKTGGVIVTVWSSAMLMLLASFGKPECSHMEWGFFGHRQINRLAVFCLPPEMFGFYKSNIDFITDHSVDPDKRRMSTVGEAERHYLDADHYCKGIPDCDPFEILPERWDEAVALLTEDTLRAYGILPWHLWKMQFDLTVAFRDKRIDRVLRLSAELGHYLGDAHVPLHTTENYNGQLTNQHGIHAFWESRVPELFFNEWDLLTGPAEYLPNPDKTAWEIVKESHHGLDSVLTFERELTLRFPEDRKYSFDERGQVIQKLYSREFSRAYMEMLNGQQERRMRAAIHRVASFWYTAWVNAGRPELGPYEQAPTDPKLIREMMDELSRNADPNIKTRQHDNE